MLNLIIFLLFFGPLGLGPNKQEINQTDADIFIALSVPKDVNPAKRLKNFYYLN